MGNWEIMSWRVDTDKLGRNGWVVPEGWEPFAIVQAPSLRSTTVYMKREVEEIVEEVEEEVVDADPTD